MTLKLGLIGKNIGRSRSPFLHETAGRLCSLPVTYQRFDLADGGDDFPTALRRCAEQGLVGVNVTHPFKEQAAGAVSIDDPFVRRIGAVNTVRFDAGGWKGFNTDFSGFIRAYGERFGRTSPGIVAIVGAGGVGKAIAFAMVRLGATEIRIADPDRPRRDRLVEALSGTGVAAPILTADSAAEIAGGADGLVNCTPLGMVGYPGTAIPATLVDGQRWAFDAVYTPVETTFVQTARAAGLEVMTGFDLFFFQGVDAFGIFCGRTPDTAALAAIVVPAVLGQQAEV